MLSGQFVVTERHSAKGRADCVVETDDYVYRGFLLEEMSALIPEAEFRDLGYHEFDEFSVKG